jgi:hypothetical protein
MRIHPARIVSTRLDSHYVQKRKPEMKKPRTGGERGLLRIPCMV